MPSSIIGEKSPPSTTPSAGRFAPSPSGPLHLGSLVAAVASYMIAKQKGGLWLVRIEDLDPPREIVGAAQSILQSLEDFGLHWDGEIIYQSQRADLYQQKLWELSRHSFVYACDCSRRVITQRNRGIYDGFCQRRKLSIKSQHALRIHFEAGYEAFYDQIQGPCHFFSSADKQDFIIRRRDGLFAYQLAVVVDDLEQNVDHIVRGVDIIDSTPRQNFLYDCFNQPAPSYYHLPLVSDRDGVKFSKRSGAAGIDKQYASELLIKALSHLNQPVDPQLIEGTPDEIIKLYEKNWDEKLIK